MANTAGKSVSTVPASGRPRRGQEPAAPTPFRNRGSIQRVAQQAGRAGSQARSNERARNGTPSSGAGGSRDRRRRKPLRERAWKSWAKSGPDDHEPDVTSPEELLRFGGEQPSRRSRWKQPFGRTRGPIALAGPRNREDECPTRTPRAPVSAMESATSSPRQSRQSPTRCVHHDCERFGVPSPLASR